MHDRIVRRVMKREGDAAFATLVETLSYIYAGKGYYIRASDEFYDELTDSLYNTDLDDVKRIIALAVECGLFDAGLFRQYGIFIFRRYPTAVSFYHQAAQQLVDKTPPTACWKRKSLHRTTLLQTAKTVRRMLITKQAVM